MTKKLDILIKSYSICSWSNWQQNQTNNKSKNISFAVSAMQNK